MWRTPDQRKKDAKDRLALAKTLWNWTPHPGQRALFLHPAQTRIAACGRRWGKTEALSVDIATLALSEAQAGRPCRQLVVAPTDAQARLIGEAVASLLERAMQTPEGQTSPFPQVTLTTRRSRALTLTLAAKPPVSIAFRSAAHDGHALRGLSAHRIVVDEAGYVPDLVLTEVLLPMLADVGGELLLASSPAGRRNAFYRFFARGLSPDNSGPLASASFQCPSTQNHHLAKAYLRGMADELGESAYAAEFEAQFIDDYGAVFREADIEAALQDDPRTFLQDGQLVSRPQPGRWYAAGVDWGRRHDFTVLCVLDATETPARVVGVWRWRGSGWQVLVDRVAQEVAAFGPLRLICDGSSIGDTLESALQEALRRFAGAGGEGRRVPQAERFVFGAESKTRLIDGLTLALSARVPLPETGQSVPALVYPSHPALLSELRAFEYGAASRSGHVPMRASGCNHDDIVIALALAWRGVPHAAPVAPSDLLRLGSSLGLPRRWSEGAEDWL